MKAFEQWNKGRIIDNRMKDVPNIMFAAYVEGERENSWKAALGWVEDMFSTNQCLAESAAEPMYNVRKEIERELQE